MRTPILVWFVILACSIDFLVEGFSVQVNQQSALQYMTKPEDFTGSLCNITVTGNNPKLSLVSETQDVAELAVISRSVTEVTFSLNVIYELDRDRPNLSPCTFYIRASDQDGSIISKQLRLYINDINDNSPTFTGQPYTWNIDERHNCKPGNGYTYASIKATDPDNGYNGTVTYQLLPDTNSPERAALYSATFNIDSRHGTVTQTAELDYETNNFYKFIVVAQDGGGRQTNETLIIQVVDVQDEPPVFTGVNHRAQVMENMPMGTKVLQVNAQDGDSGLSSTIQYKKGMSTCPGIFDVNINTGEISLGKMVDRESGMVAQAGDECLLEIVAQETAQSMQCGASNASTFITVEIVDLNDNSPTFGKVKYEATIPENTPENVAITFTDVIHVYDLDQGDNAGMTLTLENPDGSPCNDFTVVPSSINGSANITLFVRNVISLDYERRTNFNLILRATEIKDNTHETTTTLHFRTTNVNDNNPTFDSQLYHFIIKEPLSNGSFVGKVSAVDADVEAGETANITYFIIGGDSRFVIDKTSGYVYTHCVMDCTQEFGWDTKDTYQMTVVASDPGGRQGIASLVVAVHGVNNNGGSTKDGPTPIVDTTIKASTSRPATVSTTAPTIPWTVIATTPGAIPTPCDGCIEIALPSNIHIIIVRKDGREISITDKLLN